MATHNLDAKHTRGPGWKEQRHHRLNAGVNQRPTCEACIEWGERRRAAATYILFTYEGLLTWLMYFDQDPCEDGPVPQARHIKTDLYLLGEVATQLQQLRKKE